jgi:hypothetical protein
MDYENIQILMFKKTQKELTMNYVNEENKNCSISDDQNCHPDLIKTLENLGPTLASEFWIDDPNKVHYVCTGFTQSSKGESNFVILSGKVSTKGEHVVGISSGQLQIEENGRGELTAMINKVKKEAFEYFFNDKTAQGKLNFKEKEKEE